jgi:hypothetical protein
MRYVQTNDTFTGKPIIKTGQRVFKFALKYMF